MSGRASSGQLSAFVAVSIVLNLGIAHALGNLPEHTITLPEPPPLKISLSTRAAPPPPPPPQETVPVPAPAAAVEAALPVETVETARETISAKPLPPTPAPVIKDTPSEPIPEPVEEAAPIEDAPSTFERVRLARKPMPPAPEIDTPKSIEAAESPPLVTKPVEAPRTAPVRVESAAVDTGNAGATVLQNAKYRRQSAPVYPRRAYELGQQGTVLLHTEVLPNGRPGEIEVAESSGHRLLDMSALAAVKTWEFEPVTINGTTAATWVRVPVRFVIR